MADAAEGLHHVGECDARRPFDVHEGREDAGHVDLDDQFSYGGVGGHIVTRRGEPDLVGVLDLEVSVGGPSNSSLASGHDRQVVKRVSRSPVREIDERMQPPVAGPQPAVDLVLVWKVPGNEPSDGGMAEQSLEGLVEADDDRPEGVEVDLGEDLDTDVFGEMRKRHGVWVQGEG